jgi:hypothetical protein
MTRRRLAVGLFSLVIALLAVDRLVLYTWQLQVLRLYRALRVAADDGEAKPPASPYGYVSTGLEPLLVMPNRPDSPIRYLTVRTDGFLAKPSTITVDGAGGVHLRFLPPAAAWTTWLIPRTDAGEHADPVSVDPRFEYQYKIEIEPSEHTNAVSVRASRGPGHASPVLGEDASPLLFP